MRAAWDGIPLDHRPRLVHADWSGAQDGETKRWFAEAVPKGKGYCIGAPRKVGDITQWMTGIKGGARQTIVGCDFAIGLPLAYAAAVKTTSFKELLGKADDSFFRKNFALSNVSLSSPFAALQNKKEGYDSGIQGVWAELLLGEGNTIKALKRQTEIETGGQSLLWCDGAGAVGTATCHGWKHVVKPAINNGWQLWPFDGELDALVDSNKSPVLAETYPRTAYKALGIKDSMFTKTKQGPRKIAGQRILDVLVDNSLILSDDLVRELLDGFGSGVDGEDRFDAVAGVLLMALVATGKQAPGEPNTPTTRAIEGGMLGYSVSSDR